MFISPRLLYYKNFKKCTNNLIIYIYITMIFLLYIHQFFSPRSTLRSILLTCRISSNFRIEPQHGVLNNTTAICNIPTSIDEGKFHRARRMLIPKNSRLRKTLARRGKARRGNGREARNRSSRCDRASAASIRGVQEEGEGTRRWDPVVVVER